jgi:hypothetical protein
VSYGSAEKPQAVEGHSERPINHPTKDPGSATKAKGQFRKTLDDTELYLFW